MIIGLTGGIGVGKSFVASCFKKLGAAVFDADVTVYQLYRKDRDIIAYAEKNFPEVVKNNEIDKPALLEYFLAYDKNWTKFESLVHAAVLQQLKYFLIKEKKISRKLLVLDIPLLLETKFHLYCDFVIFVHANRIVQNQRLSKRNISKEKLDFISNIQFPMQLKRRLSNFTINTGMRKGCVFFQVKNILHILTPTA